MIIRVKIYNMYLPLSQSLKDKRSVIKSIITKIHNKFNVSISEIDNLNKCKYCTIGIALITNNNAYADNVFSKIEDFIDSYQYIQIVSIQQYL
ncbi:MAG: DUF503 domain-containing protein [Candidatus Cloacimonadota bacterium]|nr:MAG: DUF503 domain-containing protein [Candidatus Cloacimonadota bacterium]